MMETMQIPIITGSDNPYTTINVNFTIPLGGSVRPICKLTESSIGQLTYAGGSYLSTWVVEGKTVTRTGGTATSAAYYVTNDILYAQNLSNNYTGTYTGEIINVIDLEWNFDNPLYCGTYFYDANTAATTESNRTTAMSNAITYFSNNRFKGGLAVIRYSGGYYNQCIFTQFSTSHWFVTEMLQGITSSRIIYWQYTGGAWSKIFTLA